MNVTRDVILDLLPLYLSGEASAATGTLVKEYLQQDPELAQQIRFPAAGSLAGAGPSELPPDLELQAFRRTKNLLNWQRWLFALAIFFSATPLSNEFSFENGHFQGFRFLLPVYTAAVGVSLVLGLASWIAYFSIRRRLSVKTL